jgi:DNA-binding response OmpR family regulator
MAKVLIVEDDSVIADGMARHLAAAGFDPVVVGKGDQGLARLRFEQPDVCVLDLMLPGRDGWDVIQSARAEGIPTPIVVVSARGTEHDRVDGESAQLTPTEFRLLYQLALERGRVVTRDELLQKIWGRREAHRDRTVDVFVRRLREKIDRPAPRHTFIQTRYGVGYRLEPVTKE